MVLKIRLIRGGAKKRPYYSIVVADSHSPRDGRFIEKVGRYNPLLKKDDANRVVLKLETIQAWIAKGAQPTDRVARFLSQQGVGTWAHGNNPKKGEPGTKAKERAAERAQKAADTAAAAAEAAANLPTPERDVPWKRVSDLVPSPSPLRLSDLRELSPREALRGALLRFGIDARYAVSVGEYDYLAATIRGSELFFECCLPSGTAPVATTRGTLRWEGQADPGVLLASVLIRSLPEDVLDRLSIDLLLPDRIITFEETTHALGDGSFAREVGLTANFAGPDRSRAAYGLRAYGAADDMPFELFVSRPKIGNSSLVVAKASLVVLGEIAPFAIGELASLQSTTDQATRSANESHDVAANEALPEHEDIEDAVADAGGG